MSAPRIEASPRDEAAAPTDRIAGTGKGRVTMRTLMKPIWALGLLLAGAAHAASTVTYVYTDPQGTPLAEADASGVITATFDYAPYGSQALGSAPNGPGYTGHVNDPDTGLVYMQARYYDPSVGRFVSTDPIGPAVGNTFNFNRFAYANNSPIDNMDPDGRCTGTHICNDDGTAVSTGENTTKAGNAHSLGTHSLAQATAASQVAKPKDYSRTAPSSVAQTESDPAVKNWEDQQRHSDAFNDSDERKRYEVGMWAYPATNGGGVKIVNMPAATLNPKTGLYSSILAGDAPAELGYSTPFPFHTHPYPTPDARSVKAGYQYMAYPEPSQKDVDYARGQKTDGVVISHAGTYYFGVSVSGN